ncbi:protoporphyrinogen/coproporphyrinogen oxidase [Cellulomonas oligotrophica]|uniref:Protoporphyrinogen oxidase n=1 Tax=Cellulomonas oligotrophica TaxID=931536 RepID=A0A7Y9JY07_9CELL|nr:FAD-dependent oxidoreductase [Cellulomonas oligotrophica]NYD86436.1 oxygen-dependent protoporphyrinogen oxidase [Cellulomonas oligotrophica]GIG32673.1 protoporphyrinogen oxidase [Cellulomonas oligotrophica]
MGADGSEAVVDATWDAVVVGAGVGGLVAARDLARAGLRTLVLDARDAPGGAVRAHVVDGLRLDAGAESYATRGGTVAPLLDELGLADDVVAPEPRGSWVHLTDRDGPLPRTGLLGVPARPWAPDVRRTLGLAASLRACLDLVLPARVGAGAPTLGALVRARMGSAVVDRLVHPVVGGVHAADPDDVTVDSAAPGLTAAMARSRGSLARAVGSLRAGAPAGAAVQGLRGGMHRVVDALVTQVTAHGGVVLPRTRAAAVSREGDGVLRVRLESTRTGGAPGGDRSVRTARLVLAAPVPGLLDGLDGQDLAGVVTDDGMPVSLVTLVLDLPALDAAPRGTGVLVGPGADDVGAKALTHATAKWAWLAQAAGPGRHVVRLSYGRAGDPVPAPSSPAASSSAPAPSATATDAALPDAVRTALHDASRLLGVAIPVEALRAHAVVRWTQSLPRPSAAHQRAVARVRAAVSAMPGVAVCGAWVAGNGLASVVPDARTAAASVLAPAAVDAAAE